MTSLDTGLYRGSLQDFNDCALVFKSVLNLETQTRELIFGDPNRQFRTCLKYSIRFFDMAWSGIVPPHRENILAAIEIIQTAPRPLLFHCRHGRERTGFLAAVVRMVIDGWTFERAYQEWKDKGCRFPIYFLWKKALKNYENEIGMFKRFELRGN